MHPDGEAIPAEFHVTEVGHVSKKFIDCGGTLHLAEAIVLQTWISEVDKDHRLTAAKLSGILNLAKSVIPSDDFDIEVEYEGCVVSQYTLGEVTMSEDEIRFQMIHKHTHCLAKEACGIGESACCSTAGGGCC